MKVWWLQHRLAMRDTLRRLGHTPFATSMAILVIGVALSLPVGLYVLLQNGEKLAGQLHDSTQINIFLDTAALTEDVGKLEQLLRKEPLLRKLTFIPKERALEELAEQGNLGDVVSSLGRNPLPDAFVFEPSTNEPLALRQLNERLMALPKVTHVQLDSEWVQRLNAILLLGKQATLLLGAILSFALVAIAANTIRLQLLTRQEEVKVAKFIGATDAFIRRPLLYFGALQGLAGGLAAWGIVYGGLEYLNRDIVRLARLYGSNYQFHMLTPLDSASLMLFAMWLCWVSAYFAVSRHLRYLEPR